MEGKPQYFLRLIPFVPMMAHHGLTCFETDLPRVLALAIEVEHLAAVYSRILAMGEVSVLDDAEMDVVLEKFSTYGVQEK